MQHNVDILFSVRLLTFVTMNFRGIWNSPFTSSAHLIKKEILPQIQHSYGHKFLDPDMAFSKFLRDKVSSDLQSSTLILVTSNSLFVSSKGIFMYVMNTHYLVT